MFKTNWVVITTTRKNKSAYFNLLYSTCADCRGRRRHGQSQESSTSPTTRANTVLHFVCELFNFVEVIGRMFLMDDSPRTASSVPTTHRKRNGTGVNRADHECSRERPTSTFHEFGSVNTLDGVCALILNAVNEKIHAFLRFRFSFLAALRIPYTRYFVIASPAFNPVVRAESENASALSTYANRIESSTSSANRRLVRFLPAVDYYERRTQRSLSEILSDSAMKADDNARIPASNNTLYATYYYE